MKLREVLMIKGTCIFIQQGGEPVERSLQKREKSKILEIKGMGERSQKEEVRRRGQPRKREGHFVL